jgi:hypothetical protein
MSNQIRGEVIGRKGRASNPFSPDVEINTVKLEKNGARSGEDYFLDLIASFLVDVDDDV